MNFSLPFIFFLGFCGSVAVSKIPSSFQEILRNNYEDDSWRISGGEDAKPNEFPYTVMLIDASNDFFCGGSLINKRYILTAAHCVEKRAANMIKVRLGEFDRSKPSTVTKSVTINAEKVFYHPNFSMATTFHDVALIRLESDVEFNESVQPICLPNAAFTGSSAIVSGWGSAYFDGPPQSILQKLELDILTTSECTTKLLGYRIFMTEDKVCGWKPKKDSCKGDSGGPLVTTDKKTQIGIVNMGFHCGAMNLPGLYMRVHRYLYWINDHIADAKDSTCYA